MNFRFGPSALLSLTAAALSLTLSGCSMNSLSNATDTYKGAAIQGVAHGGYQPLTGAHIYLFAASNSGYGAASTSLMTSGDGTDSTGTYVLTTSGGGFNITGDYTCTTGQQVYLLAKGGNPGLTPASYSNSAATLIAALGTCPSSGSFAGQIPFLTVNEVSTVAAAYALAGFAVDPTHVGYANTALSKTGLTIAFNNIFNMINLNYGQAYDTTPAASGYSSSSGLSANGTVPKSKIYTLANVAAGCVNSTGPTSTACSLFFNNTPDTAGTKPTDVATALINLAHNPANSYNFVALSTGTAPFQPTLTAAPNDWSLSIKFTAPNIFHPGKPAIDASGNVWVPNIGNNSITELNPQGVVYSGTTGFTGSGLANPDAAMVDQSGNIWFSNFKNTGVVSEFNSDGSQATTNGYTTTNGFNYDIAFANVNVWLSGTNGIAAISTNGTSVYTFTGSTRDTGVTVDTSDYVWTTDNNSNQINAVYVSPLTGIRSTKQFTPAGLNTPAGISNDAASNLWIANSGANTVTKITTGTNNNGAPITGTVTSYSGAGITAPFSTFVDGAGTVWIGNSNGTLSHLTSGGVALSPTTGFTTASTSGYVAGTFYNNYFPAVGIFGFAVAGSGDIWAVDIDGSIYQFVGIAAPTVTPVYWTTKGTKP